MGGGVPPLDSNGSFEGPERPLPLRTEPATRPRRATAPPTDRPTSAANRSRGLASWAWLALLMAGTSGAVGSWVSWWLVLPYLALMAWLLAPSAGRPRAGSASDDPTRSKNPRSARPTGALDGEGQSDDDEDEDPASDPSASAGGDESGSSPGASPKPAKARRGKGRPRKVAKPPAEPTEATWFQVAPGKFVRVEASDESPEQAGPHLAVGDQPVELPGTPPPPQPGEPDPFDHPEIQAAETGPTGPDPEGLAEGPVEEVDLAGGPIDDADPGEPIGDEESGSSTEEGRVETARPPGMDEAPQAAVGNAPQAWGRPESPEASGLESPPEAVDDRPKDDPEGEESDPWGDPSPLGDGFEPTGFAPEALANVAPEEPDAWGASDDATDPTETPVDETDLDDAGPFDAEPFAEDFPADAKSPRTESRPDAEVGPSRWPRAFAPRAFPRVEARFLRSTGRESPPRRPLRSPGGPSRPSDPGRLARRGLGRPRQGRRTFPPRSPPSGRVGRRRAI